MPSFLLRTFSIALVALFILIAIALSGFEYWWRGTPQYSLNQIAYAIKTHDIALFRKHVDARSVASRLMDDVLATEDARQDGIAMVFAEAIKPQILQQWEAQIERYVETGTFEADKNGDDSLKTLHARVADRIGPLREAKREGRTSTVILILLPKNKNESAAALDLKLRQTEDGYWQLMEVSLPRSLIARKK